MTFRFIAQGIWVSNPIAIPYGEDRRAITYQLDGRSDGWKVSYEVSPLGWHQLPGRALSLSEALNMAGEHLQDMYETRGHADWREYVSD